VATTVSEATLVRKALQGLEAQLNDGQVKGIVGDLVRLLELRRDLRERRKTQTAPEEIKVTWVDPQEDESNSER
jgi:hypothetical protein